MIPNPWVILGAAAAFLLAITGAFFEGRHYSDLSWKAANAKQEKISSDLYIDALNRVAKGDAAYAAKTRELETQYAQDIDAANAGRDDFAKRLRLAYSRKSCPSPVPGETTSAGKASNPPGGSDDGLRDVAFESSQRLRDVVKALQADVRFCWAFAATVGR